MSSETVEPQNKTKQKQAINAKPTGLQKLKLLGEMFVHVALMPVETYEKAETLCTGMAGSALISQEVHFLH